jgi:hypothetical protein
VEVFSLLFSEFKEVAAVLIPMQGQHTLFSPYFSHKLLQICIGIVTFMDGKWIFPCLNGANCHAWAVQMTTLLCSQGL